MMQHDFRFMIFCLLAANDRKGTTMSPIVHSADTAGATRNTAFSHSPEVQTRTQYGSDEAIRRMKTPGARRIVAEVLPGFSRRLAAMLSAGMPILSVLKALENQARNENFKAVLGQIRSSIENGSALSQSLSQFPSIFDEFYINMIKSGETCGQLPETIKRLADYLERSAKLSRRVKSAMTYPVVVLCIAITIAAGMITFVVPVFGEMFKTFDSKLPGPTQFLLDVSGGVKNYGVYIAVIVAALVVAFRKWKATPEGRYLFDCFVLRLPVVGDFNKKIAAARFARTFGQLTRGGVPILTALEVVAGATGNSFVGQAVLNSRKTVEKGDPLSSAMLTNNAFSDMLVEMLQAGEKTGRIDEMMDCIADFYDDEVDSALASLTSLLEPFLMVFLGVIVGGIVLCMFLPMVGLIRAIH